MKNNFLILIIIFFASCSKGKKEVQIGNKVTHIENNSGVTPNQDYLTAYRNKGLMKELAKDIIQKGDTLAFEELRKIYFLGGENSREFLYYAIYMAENYDYPQAYGISYMILSTDSISLKNTRTNMIANYYLLKACEKGDKSSIYSLEERFKDRHIPKSQDYWESFN